MEIAQEGKEDDLKEAILLGLDLNRADENGMTALMVATKHANLDVVKMLIENGANPRLKNKRGERAADLAPKSGQGRKCLNILNKDLDNDKHRGN